ncbi:MAG TPA: hypothetical protein ENK96_00090 [Desulfobulbaceae bacterium]|nr:hypothetical protein [Desulfobulbaceae bacterium]
MKDFFLLLVILFFLCGTASAKEVNREKCASYINMYCTRCHTSGRICDGLKKNDEDGWRKIISEMAENDSDIDQDVQVTVHACLTSMPADDPVVCAKKSD